MEVFYWNTSDRVIDQMKHKELKNEKLLALNHTYMCDSQGWSNGNFENDSLPLTQSLWDSRVSET